MKKKTRNLLLLAGAGVGAWYLYKKSKEPEAAPKEPEAAPRGGLTSIFDAITSIMTPGAETAAEKAAAEEAMAVRASHATKTAELQGYGSLGSAGAGSLSSCNGPFGCSGYGSLG